MTATTKFAYNGTAYVLAGAFSATGSTLISLGEMATVSMPVSGGNKAMVRTASGHPSAEGGVDYGRLVGLNVELDTVTKAIMADLLSAAQVDTNGAMSMSTTAGAIVPISAAVIPSRNINQATGAVIDPDDVYWLPFLTDDGEFTMTFNNSRGEAANSPVTINLMGLVGDKYGATVLPLDVRNFLHGDPTDKGLTWKLPAPYQAA